METNTNKDIVANCNNLYLLNEINMKKDQDCLENQKTNDDSTAEFVVVSSIFYEFYSHHRSPRLPWNIKKNLNQFNFRVITDIIDCCGK